MFSYSRWLSRWAAAALIVSCALIATAQPSGADPFGPAPAPNRHLGPPGTATMHGDGESSDTTPLPGPGAGAVRASFIPLAAACPTILQGADGLPQALCTTIAGRTPAVYLLDPGTGQPLTAMPLAQGSLLGGVYAYLDDRDRLVTVDGNGTLLRIAHELAGGGWRLRAEAAIALGPAIATHCGHPGCDLVATVAPGIDGRVWFATDNGAAGYADPRTAAVRMLALGPGEHIANSISTSVYGTAITTDRALYLVGTAADGSPKMLWRKEYDRGPARKPGQLSWGSGATPTFFGREDGASYLAITDNAAPQENLLVFDSRTGYLRCTVRAVDGTENSPIGAGNSIFVASTYGYRYPAVPPAAGPAVPAAAPISGGLARIDIEGDRCTQKWSVPVRSAAVPRLSRADNLIYTVARTGSELTAGYDYLAIDAASGQTRAQHRLAAGPQADTLQMVGTIAAGRVLYQGTVFGVFRIAAG